MEGLDALGSLFGGGGGGSCDHVCPGGLDKVRNKDHVPTSNGCGTGGFKINSEFEFTPCCDVHDKVCGSVCPVRCCKTQADKFTSAMTPATYLAFRAGIARAKMIAKRNLIPALRTCAKILYVQSVKHVRAVSSLTVLRLLSLARSVKRRRSANRMLRSWSWGPK